VTNPSLSKQRWQSHILERFERVTGSHETDIDTEPPSLSLAVTLARTITPFREVKPKKKSSAQKPEPTFLHLAGRIEGASDLSTQKGFSTTSAPIPAKPLRATVEKRRTNIK